MPQSKGKNVDPRFKRMSALNSILGKMYIDKTNEPGGYQRYLQNMNNLIPGNKEKTGETLRATKDAPKIIEKILQDLESGRLPPPVSYTDPDQSPLKDGYEAQVLREKWSCGMDVPFGINRPMGLHYFSQVFTAMLLGNYSDFMTIVESLDKEELSKMLTRREGYLQLSPMVIPILGARVFWAESMARMSPEEFANYPIVKFVYQGRVHRQHMEILKKLIELGAEVDSHDLAGYTPLHHCLSCSGNDYTLQMAEVLLRQGKAQVDAVNRFGVAALQECVIPQKLDFIKLLIRYNADPYLKDNDGYSAMYLSQYHPNVRQILRKGEKRVFTEKRNAAKAEGSLKVCIKCKGPADKRCKGCYMAWYCEASCQKSDWPNHRSECKKIRGEYEVVKPILMEADVLSMKTGVAHKFSVAAKASHFVLKVQPTFGENTSMYSMLCYNEARDVQYYLSSTTEIGAKLIKAVKEQGFHKGFFQSIVVNNQHYIHPSILPPEKW
eukprot:TRINITY_DN16631_c0_g1_i1.p1 TRINITY_DN16631_c0_g1~~TRINITY_DN16631_c0_g1_i1.p1  ORF type:complete len:495 (-),score=93.14 TRINITY_DN16631_c0_g1_i1:127-1611(-)